MRNRSISLRLAVYCSVSAMLVAAAFTIGMMSGSVRIEFADFWLFITDPGKLSPSAHTILADLRLPRVLLGIFTGAALALAGTGFQGILRNPLADPYIVGTSSGASLGACLAIILHIPSPVTWLSPVPFFAFIGALAAMIIVYKLAEIDKKVPVETFLLAGVVVSSFAGALVSFLMTIAGNDLHRAMLWLMGTLGQSDMQSAMLMLPYLIVGAIALIIMAPALNIAGMGEETASSLGVNTEHLKLGVIAAGSLITAAAVAFSGLIGFMGLFIPHITRMITGPDHRILLPVSALNGAAFLVLADTFARTLAAPKELPVGVITAIVGAPFFFWLLRRKKRLF